jgi:hypothetical protein
MNKIAVNFGTVEPPPVVNSLAPGGNISGLQVLLTIILRSLVVGAGIYAVINFVLAGYWYLGGSGDPKKVWDATNKIWHSVIGLILAAGAFVLAAILGQILFNNPDALLQLRFFTP